jgi:hypothetical protein
LCFTRGSRFRVEQKSRSYAANRRCRRARDMLVDPTALSIQMLLEGRSSTIRQSEDVDVVLERATHDSRAFALARVSVELQMIAGQRGKRHAPSRLACLPPPKCRFDRRPSCANWPHCLLDLAYNHKQNHGYVDNANNLVPYCNEDHTPANQPMIHLSPLLPMSSLSLFALVVGNTAGVC